MRRNQEVAKILHEIADMLEINGENMFKIRAYRRAAQSIESIPEDIEEVYRKGKLEEIPGVGKNIADHITEFLNTGKIEKHRKLKKQIPVDADTLMQIGGLGPKKIMKLYKKLHVRSLADLEKAAKSGKISRLPGFGKKSEEAILTNAKFAGSATRMLLGSALPIAESAVAEINGLDFVKQCEMAGSLRRRKETIGDIDILVTSSDAGKVIDYFVKMKDVHDVIARGPTKATVRMNSGVQMDLRVLPDREFGSALLYFTGSKEHNVELRRIAISRKMKLSEYGLFKGNKNIASFTEKEIYKKLGLDYIEPELRETAGEIEAAKAHRLPQLVKYSDIKGDLQMHTTWSDGTATIGEMALAARRLGREYVCITDHGGRIAIAGGLNERQLEKQAKEVAAVNAKMSGITILHGCEVNIGKGGKPEISDQTLKKLDVVVASVHSGFKTGKEEMTNRIITAMENPHVDVIGHPTGRLINKRPGYEIDLERLLEASKRTNTYLEVDSGPDRLDLNDVNIRAAVNRGCVLSMGSDAHAPEHLRFIELGVATARRGWAEKKNILTTRTLAQLKKLIDMPNV